MKCKFVKMLLLSLSLIVLLSACGGGRQESNDKKIIIGYIGDFLTDTQKNSMENAKLDIEAAELFLKGYTGEEKNVFNEVLDLMKQGKSEEVSKLYLSLKDTK